ncbi:MAG: transposase [Actinomycetia bacterium]|nr:transposase [Actinomycetes bacterium]
MEIKNYFIKPKLTKQKQYEALRSFFVDELSAETAAKKFGYTLSAFYSLVANFRKSHKNASEFYDQFFKVKKKGRKEKPEKSKVIPIIIEMRKKNFSVPDIKVLLDSKGFDVSEKSVYLILRKEGFARLPRRPKQFKPELPKMKAEKSMSIDISPETFSTNLGGVFCFLPYLQKYNILKIISKSSYPSTKTIKNTSAILAFIALKLSNMRRYSADDLWCMDRGLGLFAGMNVLPKTAWFSSYSSPITREMNISFLKELHKIWVKNELLSDTSNLDFVTVPYWGDGSHLENNWSGKRRQSMPSMLAVLAQDPDSGIIDYGNTDVMHKNESAVVLEYLDFYRSDQSDNQKLRYLVFDSKFTNYENLNIIDERGVKFVTIRRRGKNIVKEIESIHSESVKKIRVMNANMKGRTLYVNDRNIILKGYHNKKEIRQISITGHGKIKPALIITNDFDLKIEDIVRKYSRRWLVEKTIAEQTDFFHLNRISSSMVIKVDFDLTMTILAHNLYRLFALELDRYSHLSDVKIFEKFIANSGTIEITNNNVNVKLKKKRNLPTLLTVMDENKNIKITSLNNKKIAFSALNHS